MNTRSSSRNEQSKKATATNNAVQSNEQHQNKSCETATMQQTQVSTNNVVTRPKLPTRANKANAAHTQSTQGSSKRVKVANSNEPEANASLGNNESTTMSTTGVQDYFLDCKHCQNFCLNVGLPPTKIGFNYEPHLWDSSEYRERTKDQPLHIIHANTLITLIQHKYHNELCVVFPTVFEADILELTEVSNAHTPGPINNIFIPNGKSLLVVCMKEYRYYLLRIAQQKALKKHGVSLLENDKEWAVISFDCFPRTAISQLRDQFLLLNRTHLRMAQAQIEFMIEKNVPRVT
jgi:hypothetical protein